MSTTTFCPDCGLSNHDLYEGRCPVVRLHWNLDAISLDYLAGADGSRMALPPAANQVEEEGT